MKKQWLLALLVFPIFYVQAKDPCTQKGWQEAKVTRIEAGDEYGLLLTIVYNGKKQSVWASCGESCYGFTTAITGENYSAPLNQSVKVKLGRTEKCAPNDIECMETGSAICFIKDLKLISTGSVARAVFTQAGLEDKPILKFCYRDPCSVAKVMSYKVLENHSTNQLLKLNLIGGSKNWDSKKITWNHKAHDVYIRCSLTKPTVQIGEQKTLIPLNPNGVYGAVMSDAGLYLKACHNYKGSDAEAAQRFGYNVQEP